MRTMTIRMPEATHARLKQLARMRKVSVNKLLDELLDDQHSETRIGLELLDCVAVRSQGRLDIGRARVTYADPDDLRGEAAEQAPFVVIGILGDDREFLVPCVAPNLVIRR